MNWNQNGGNWPELKRQAKRQESVAQNTRIKPAKQGGFIDISPSTETAKIANIRAEAQLSELHDLLKVMGNIQSEINNSFYK